MASEADNPSNVIDAPIRGPTPDGGGGVQEQCNTRGHSGGRAVVQILVLMVVAGAAYFAGTRSRSKPTGATAQKPAGATAQSKVTTAPHGGADLSRTGFSPLEVDLGKQPWFASVPFETAFVNAGPEPVTIATVKTSCGCTTIDARVFVDRTVARGAQVPVRGEVHLNGQLGRRAETIDLLLTTGAVHTVVISFETYATYRVVPETLDLGRVDLDAGDDVSASAVFTSDTESIIGTPSSDVPWLEAAVEQRGAGESLIVVHLVKRHAAHG